MTTILTTHTHAYIYYIIYYMNLNNMHRKTDFTWKEVELEYDVYMKNEYFVI